jgi:hypothetical protein
MTGASTIIVVMTGHGVDLSAHEAELAKLVEQTRDFYRDLCAHETRRDKPGPRPLEHRNPNPWVLDDDGLNWTIEDWEELRRKPGRPANDPLRFIYWIAQGYWNYHIGLSRWRPVFERHTSTDTVAVNACAAFLLALAQSIDRGFTAANCHAVYDRERRKSHTPAAQERRTVSRRERQRTNKPPT